MDSYSSISITNLKKIPITRDMIHINEDKIRKNIGDTYENTMNHQVKIKDTKNSMFPVNGSFNNSDIFKTTTQALSAEKTFDPYHTEYYNKRMDFQKRYAEEMLKAKNMMSTKKESGK